MDMVWSEILIRKALQQPINMAYPPEPITGSPSLGEDCLNWMLFLQRDWQPVVQSYLNAYILTPDIGVASPGADPNLIINRAYKSVNYPQICSLIASQINVCCSVLYKGASKKFNV